MTLLEFFFQPPQSDYHPSWPQALRYIGWAIRNPLPGLSIALRTDSMPGVSTWASNGGWLFLRHGSGLPFVSYRPKDRASFPWIEFYIGWRPSGSPGFALRRAYSKGY